MKVQEAMKLKFQVTTNHQPCCGCIHFNKCGSVIKSAPFSCDDRITVDELERFPTKNEMYR